jgi:flavodoxin
MNIEIYYFIGTGNSNIVAKDIADRLNGNLIPIKGIENGDKL